MLDTQLSPLPGSLELPESDGTAVDSELQSWIPTLLYRILISVWGHRQDWFFGIDMGIYTPEGQRTSTPIVPDAFLSLKVPRHREPQGRLSYVLAEENQVVPTLVLEYVSKTPGGEYGDKLNQYAQMGIRYYVICNPHYWRRDQRDPFEVHELIRGKYQRLLGNPIWLEAVGLGIGMERRETDQWERDWVYWYDQQGQRYPTPEERIEQERTLKEQAEAQAEQERIRADKLAEMLRSLGVDLPADLTES